MRIFKEKAGVISPESVWVCIYKEYLYIESNLIKLLFVLLFEWNDDKHFVG